MGGGMFEVDSPTNPVFTRDERLARRHLVVTLDGDEPACSRKGPSDGELVELLEHDKDLSITELVEGMYGDVLDREELRAETKLANPQEPLPPELVWFSGRPISSDGLFNFSQQVSRRELKRFGSRLQRWLVTNHMLPPEKIEELKARAQAARAQRSRDLMVGFFFLTLAAFVVVLTYKLWVTNL